MNLLIDTAVFIWSVFDEGEKISERAWTMLKDEGHQLTLSAASIWEIAIKHSLGKLELQRPLDELIFKHGRQLDIVFLPIAPHHAIQVSKLPFHHKDPFDRLLIAQAKVEGLPILTPDLEFEKYGVEVIW